VKEYLERKEQERDNAFRKEAHEMGQDRRLHLLRLGLYEKEYTDNGVSSRYPDWDQETGKAFRKVPINVTEEEYAAICSYEKEETVDDRAGNPMARALVVIAWITFIGGFLAGIILAVREVESGYYSTDNVFVWSVAITCWASSFISGVLFLGFAEIIKLLNAMVSKES